MSQPPDATHDDQTLVHYLLGLLPEDETERLDELSIADDEVASRLHVVEDDLVDAYVAGTLAAPSRAPFEQVYFSSPLRREKVRFAQSLRLVTDRALEPVGAYAGRADSRRAVADGRRPPRQSRWYGGLMAALRGGWGLTAVAAMLLLVIVAPAFFQARQLRHQLEVASAQRAALDRRAQELEQQLTVRRTAEEETARELARMRALLAESAQPAAAGRPPGRPSFLASGVPALLLSPPTRSTGPIPTLAIRPGVEAVAFELSLETRDFARYAVALTDPATGATLWRSGRLAPSATGQALIVDVPVHGLQAQHYTLVLEGIGAAGGAETLGSYTFRIARR